MSRFTKELRVIPKVAWIVAWLAYLCISVPLFLFVAPTDPEMGKWPRWGQALLILWATAIFLFTSPRYLLFWLSKVAVPKLPQSVLGKDAGVTR